MRVMKKNLITCISILFFSTSLVCSQTSMSEQEKNTLIYGERSTYIQGNSETDQSQMVTKVMNADMYDYIFTILKDNLWFVVVICIIVVIVLYSIIFILACLIKGIGKKFDNSEYIEFGKFRIKNRNYRGQDQSSSNIRTFDVDKFLSMLSLILESELSNSISRTIDVVNSVHILESNYKCQCESIFKNTFSTIKNEFYLDLIAYIVNITGFANADINKTREYFFISDMLQTADFLWSDHSNDIINRNGFVEIVNDKKKADVYIEELQDIIWQAIDVKKLEVTDIQKSELDEIIIKVQKRTRTNLENMFVRLGNLKKSMIEKKDNKLSIVDTDIKESINRLLSEIKNKFLSPNEVQQELQTTQHQQTNNESNNSNNDD